MIQRPLTYPERSQIQKLFMADAGAGHIRKRPRGSLVSPRAAGIENDLPLSFHNPLVVPLGASRAMATTAVPFPFVAHLTLVLELADALLSVSAHSVRDLDELEDVLLLSRFWSATGISRYKVKGGKG